MTDLVLALAKMIVFGLQEKPLLGSSDLKHRNIALQLPMSLAEVFQVPGSSSPLFTLFVHRALVHRRSFGQPSNLVQSN